MVSGEAVHLVGQRVLATSGNRRASGSRRKLALPRCRAQQHFVVIDGVTQAVDLNIGQVKRIADRRRGTNVTSPVAHTPDDPDADFRYTIYNADGSRAGQCRNGARCVGRFLREKRLTRKLNFAY